MDSGRLGRWGETLAAEYLRAKQYEIIGANYRTRHGEIDIIATCGGYVAFVEVKLRKNRRFADAREFVTPLKRQKILAAAQMWLSENETGLQPRFDVIEIYAPLGEKTPRMEIYHIEDAF